MAGEGSFALLCGACFDYIITMKLGTEILCHVYIIEEMTALNSWCWGRAASPS